MQTLGASSPFIRRQVRILPGPTEVTRAAVDTSPSDFHSELYLMQWVTDALLLRGLSVLGMESPSSTRSGMRELRRAELRPRPPLAMDPKAARRSHRRCTPWEGGQSGPAGRAAVAGL